MFGAIASTLFLTPGWILCGLLARSIMEYVDLSPELLYRGEDPKKKKESLIFCSLLGPVALVYIVALITFCLFILLVVVAGLWSIKTFEDHLRGYEKGIKNRRARHCHF